MKKEFITVFLALCIALVPVAALAEWQGINAWTGEEWQALEQEDKPAFIIGMVEGLKFRGPDMGPWEPVTEDLEEFIPEIDETGSRGQVFLTHFADHGAILELDFNGRPHFVCCSCQ